MKEQSKIPTGKVQRASRFIKAGAKVGGNIVKHYTKKVFDKDLSVEALHSSNAEDIYKALSQLKGGALKVLQMISLDRNMLPEQYREKFSEAQNSAPPLSYPLIVKTFKQCFGKVPTEIFSSFTRQAVNAASIGQVHQAEMDGKKLAIKIQYPGVADSIVSDLRMVKPAAKLMFNLSAADIEYYMEEVETKLIEETDYSLELKQSMEITKACAALDSMEFTKYYPEWSCKKVLTMDWLEGDYLQQFLNNDPPQEIRDKAGQVIWDFYDFQIHQLRMLQADSHPGNFLFYDDGRVGVLDFGCVKVLPEEFYNNYFRIHDSTLVNDEAEFETWLYKLNFLNETDKPHEKVLFKQIFTDITLLLCEPFYSEYFDFGDDRFFVRMFEMGERIARTSEIRNSRNSRGPRDAIFINRTYFGLFQLLNNLGARIHTKSKYNERMM